MILTAEAVHDLAMDCLYSDGEDTSDAVIVRGVTMTVGFDPIRIRARTEDIRALLGELPIAFQGKDGDSFLNACVRRDGTQWGEHRDVQALMLLGLAAGLVWVLDRQFWPVCPGGMPLFGIKA